MSNVLHSCIELLISCIMHQNDDRTDLEERPSLEKIMKIL